MRCGPDGAAETVLGASSDTLGAGLAAGGGAAGASTRVPQAPQKRAPSSSEVPQLAHCMGCPHGVCPADSPLAA